MCLMYYDSTVVQNESDIICLMEGGDEEFICNIKLNFYSVPLFLKSFDKWNNVNFRCA